MLFLSDTGNLPIPCIYHLCENVWSAETNLLVQLISTYKFLQLLHDGADQGQMGWQMGNCLHSTPRFSGHFRNLSNWKNRYHITHLLLWALTMHPFLLLCPLHEIGALWIHHCLPLCITMDLDLAWTWPNSIPYSCSWHLFPLSRDTHRMVGITRTGNWSQLPW